MGNAQGKSGYFETRMYAFVCAVVVLALNLCSDARVDAGLRSADIEIQVREVRAGFANRLDVRQFRLDFKLIIQNSSTEAVQLSREQFRLECDGESFPVLTTSSLRVVPSGKEQAIELSFSGINIDREQLGEPNLTLIWSGQDVEQRVELNQKIRDTSPIVTRLLGPDGSLGLLQVGRDVAVLAVSLLRDHIQKLHKDGCRRLVFIPDHADRQMQTDEPVAWLERLLTSHVTSGSDVTTSSQTETLEGDAFLDVRLCFHRPHRDSVGGPASQEPVKLRYHARVDEAVVAALTPVYRFVEPELILRDLFESDRGVCEAAATAIDRLDTSQQEELFERLLTASNGNLDVVIPQLHRITSPGAISVLGQLALADDEQVSAAAIQCLTLSMQTDAERKLTELWNCTDAPLREQLQDRIVASAIEADDHRWSEFVLNYSEKQLEAAANGNMQFTAGFIEAQNGHAEAGKAAVADVRGDAAAELPAPAEPPADPDGPIPFKVVSNEELGRLRLALAYLRSHENERSLDLLRRHLLAISLPQLQDIVAESIWAWQRESDGELIRTFLRSRLTSHQITDTIRNAVLIFPDTEWAPYLLEEFRSENTNPRSRQRSLQSALRCANPETLRPLIDQFYVLDNQFQLVILEHVAAVDYPGWHELAEKSFYGSSSLFNQVMDVLHTDGSERAILILCRRLNKLIEPVPGTNDVRPEDRVFAERLISRVSLFAHPEARRILNRCSRCPDGLIRGRTQGALSAAARRSPSEDNFKSAIELLDAGATDEALSMVNSAIRNDELRPGLYLLRGRILLRMSELAEAEADIRRADQLNPESADIWCGMAMLFVLQGEIQRGVKLADAAANLDPTDTMNLVVASSVFAQALTSDVSASAETQRRYADRGLALLNQAIDHGFSNGSRFKQGPEFSAFRNQPGWQSLIDRLSSAK